MANLLVHGILCTRWSTDGNNSETLRAVEKTTGLTETTRVEAFSDGVFAIAITLLLLGVTFVPFPTNVLAENIRHPVHSRTAALFYSGTFFVIAVFFNVLWRYASGRMRLMDEGVEAASVQAITDQYRFGPIVYLVAFVAAFFSAWASVMINLGLALFFAIPAEMAPGRRRG